MRLNKKKQHPLFESTEVLDSLLKVSELFLNDEYYREYMLECFSYLVV